MTNWEEQFEDMLVLAWERELATFLGDLAWDLEDGLITVDEALQRLEAIKERKPFDQI